MSLRGMNAEGQKWGTEDYVLYPIVIEILSVAAWGKDEDLWRPEES